MSKVNMKNPLRVEVITKYFYPVTAGIETNIKETYKFLAEKGWNITIHTSKDIYTQKNALDDEDMVNGLHVKRYPFLTFGYWPKIDWSHTDVVCLHNFDIFPHFQLLLHAFLLKIMGKKKFALILTPHGGYNPTWDIYSPLQKFIKQTYNKFLGTPLINAVVDDVRAVSAWEKKEMIKMGIKPSLISVISNGIENEAYEDIDKKASAKIKKTVKSFGSYILQIGRIYEIKNYETTIKALPYIPKNINFVIVGPMVEESYKKSLIALAKKLGVEKRLIFAGTFHGVDKYYVIKHAQLMVHMAIWESFCNVVHEGMSQGLVCVVANNTALPLLIKDGVNGYLVDTFDSETLQKKVNYILDHMNSKEITAMKKKNIDFGLKDSWESTARKMETLYTTSLSKI
jgi:glycosyltransferase involved in cell wall biosynthesis